MMRMKNAFCSMHPQSCSHSRCDAGQTRANHHPHPHARSFYTEGVPRDPEYPRRVVVTGLGVVTPLGGDVAANWDALRRGKCGTRAIGVGDLPENERAGFPAGKPAPSASAGVVAAEAYDGGKWEEHGRLARFVGFARCAAAEAVRDSGLLESTTARTRGERVGVSFGAGMGGTHDLTSAGGLLRSGELRKIGPYFVPRILANAGAGRISMDYSFRGPNLAASTACATSAHCIGEAFRALQRGDADVMLAGGTEACIDAVSLAAFAKARALSLRGSAKPFDPNRDGFVMGEGAGVLVLETLEHARQRGVEKVYAEIRGYGATGDAHHVTRASPDGEGAARAVLAALRDAGVRDFINDVGYVNAHATGTTLGDAAEVNALRTVFGAEAIENGTVITSSTKGATGHLLGAAGAIEAAYTILTLHTGDVPPTVGHDEIDPHLRLPVVGTGVRLRADARAAVSNSFGFGGTNASLVFAKPPPLV